MLINPKEILEKGIVKRSVEGSLQPNSIDLTVKAIYELDGMGSMNADGTRETPRLVEAPLDKYYYLYPGKAYSVDFNEWVEVPEGMAAFIQCRSTLNRCGVIATSGIYDSGFKNNVGAMLRVMHPIRIEPGARVATIYFVKADSSHLYTGVYQGK